MPLGSVEGDEALNAWAHIAFSEWLEFHALPGDEDLERQRQIAFENECVYWEEVIFRLPVASALDSSELTELEDDFLDDQSYD